MSMKCIVCAYTFKGNEKKDSMGDFICPYCGTIKEATPKGDSFKREALMNKGYSYLAESKIKDADKCFTEYYASYGDEDNQYRLGRALLDCRLSNCFDKKNNRLITVVHQESLKDVLHNPSFLEVIEKENPIIYKNVMDLYEKENPENKKENSVIVLSKDLGMLDRLEGYISEYSNVCRIDYLDMDIESKIYPNIKNSKALVVYVDESKMITNEYFLSIYYRFKAFDKNVIFVHNGAKIGEMYQDDTIINAEDSDIKEKISLGIYSHHKQNKDEDLGYIMESTEVKSIVGKNIALPTNAQSISSRAAFQSEVSKLIISSTGEFEIKERAFAESAIESLNIESKNLSLTIGKDAFSNCKALKNIVFSCNKLNLENNAFRDCISLSTINLSMFQNMIIPDHCFDGCRSLSHVEFNQDIKEISKYAFRNTNILEITISTKTKVDPQAFSGCSSLSKVIVYGNDVSNLVIEDTTFTEGTTIKFIGKNAKKCFKDTKKAFKKLYKIEFVKEIK